MNTLSFNTPPSQNAFKILASGLSALCITFLLFAAMQQLIKIGALPRQEIVDIGPVQLFSPEPDTDIIVRPTMPKMPEPQIRDIPLPQPTTGENTTIGPDTLSIGPVDIPTNTGPTLQHNQTDRSATPLVRVEPRYPIEAARDGITGWVRLGFTIDHSGSVTDIKILAAEPANLFNREAIRALRRWKYQPQMVEGKPVNQLNMQVQLDFSLQTD